MSTSFKIVEKRRGKIIIDSTEGEGATVTVFLPTDLPRSKGGSAVINTAEFDN